MRVRALVLVAVFMLVSSPVSAQVYRWVDGQGGVHYTDGLNGIPEPYRETAQLIQKAPPPPPSSSPTEPPASSRVVRPRKSAPPVQGPRDPFRPPGSDDED